MSFETNWFYWEGSDPHYIMQDWLPEDEIDLLDCTSNMNDYEAQKHEHASNLQKKVVNIIESEPINSELEQAAFKFNTVTSRKSRRSRK